jgi:hypothetical protein
MQERRFYIHLINDRSYEFRKESAFLFNIWQYLSLECRKPLFFASKMTLVVA